MAEFLECMCQHDGVKGGIGDGTVTLLIFVSSVSVPFSLFALYTYESVCLAVHTQ